MGNSLDHMAMCHAKKRAIFFVALPLSLSYFCLIVAAVFCVCVCVYVFGPTNPVGNGRTSKSAGLRSFETDFVFVRILFAKREKNGKM